MSAATKVTKLGERRAGIRRASNGRHRITLHVSPHCHERPVSSVDRLGRIVFRCLACERNRAGMCRDCPRATVPRGCPGGAPMRCPRCAKAKARRVDAANHRRARANPNTNEHIRKTRRARYARPDIGERQRQAMRNWYAFVAAHPVLLAQQKARRQEVRDAKRAAIRAGLPVTAWRSFDPRKTADPSHRPRSVAA